MKIKKGDTVLIKTGKDRGKTGKIEQALPKVNKVLISGLNIIKKHTKPSKKHPKGGVIEISAPINVSNVMFLCPKCRKATRIGYKIIQNKKNRICKKCGEQV